MSVGLAPPNKGQQSTNQSPLWSRSSVAVVLHRGTAGEMKPTECSRRRASHNHSLAGGCRRRTPCHGSAFPPTHGCSPARAPPALESECWCAIGPSVLRPRLLDLWCDTASARCCHPSGARLRFPASSLSLRPHPARACRSGCKLAPAKRRAKCVHGATWTPPGRLSVHRRNACSVSAGTPVSDQWRTSARAPTKPLCIWYGRRERFDRCVGPLGCRAQSCD